MRDCLTSQIAPGLRAKRIRLSLLIVIGLATSCTSPKPPKQEDEKVSIIPVKRLVFAPPPEGFKHKPRVTIHPVEGVDQLRNLSIGATTEELTSVVFALDRFRVVESMPAAPTSENADYLILCKLTELAYEQRKGNTYVDGSKLASKGLRSVFPWLGGSDIDNVMWTQDDLDVRVTCRVVANLLLPNGEVLARETGLVQRQDKVKAIKAEVLGVVIDSGHDGANSTTPAEYKPLGEDAATRLELGLVRLALFQAFTHMTPAMDKRLMEGPSLENTAKNWQGSASDR